MAITNHIPLNTNLIVHSRSAFNGLEVAVKNQLPYEEN